MKKSHNGSGHTLFLGNELADRDLKRCELETTTTGPASALARHKGRSEPAASRHPAPQTGWEAALAAPVSLSLLSMSRFFFFLMLIFYVVCHQLVYVLVKLTSPRLDCILPSVSRWRCRAHKRNACSSGEFRTSCLLGASFRRCSECRCHRWYLKCCSEHWRKQSHLWECWVNWHQAPGNRNVALQQMQKSKITSLCKRSKFLQLVTEATSAFSFTAE